MKTARDEAINFVNKTINSIEEPIQEYCFLELASPSIEDGIATCVQKGATKIAVVPVLLLTATHAKKDIPDILQSLKDKYVGVEISYGQPLGVQEKIIDVLIERIQEQKQITSDMDILLVGRGSSDQQAVIDIKKIAKLLEQRIGVSSVNVCFLAAATPKFNDLLVQTVDSPAKRVVILPYLLFTGILMREIQTAVGELELADEQEIYICDYLGSHPNVTELLRRRAIEAIDKNKSETLTVNA